MFEIKLTKEFKTLFIITFLYDYAIKKVHKTKNYFPISPIFLNV